MESIEKPINDKIYDIKKILKGLFFAYPNVNYIAINPGMTSINESNWNDTWYMVGFEKKPVLSYVDDYLKWVDSEETTTGDDEIGVFFLHFCSFGYYIDNELLQLSRTEFMNPIDLCFTLNKNGDIVKCKAEKIPETEESNELDDMSNIHDIVDLFKIK